MSKKAAQEERMRLWVDQVPFCSKPRVHTVPDEEYEHQETSAPSNETPKKAASNATQSYKSPQSAEKSSQTALSATYKKVETNAPRGKRLARHETACESPKLKSVRKVDAPSFPKRTASGF